MAESNGWIKLHRKIDNWCWFNEPNTFLVFIHLLLMANVEDKNWRGVVVKRGSVITSVFRLSKRTGVSIRSVRTSLTHLKSTNEVTMYSTSKYTVISINNFNTYQEVTSQLTNSRQGTDKVPTTTKEYKNIRNKEYISPTPLKTYGKEEWSLEQVGKGVVEAFNTHLGRKFKFSSSILRGLEFWLKTYEPKEIEQAIYQVQFDKFWVDKMTPVILFRQKNPQGEPVDYIGGLLNKKETYDDTRRKN